MQVLVLTETVRGVVAAGVVQALATTTVNASAASLRKGEVELEFTVTG